MSCKKILIATLNWGLGHTTRTIPVIDHLLNEGHEIFLASDGIAGLVLKEAFPDLPYSDLPSYRIRYAERSFYRHWLKQSIMIQRARADEQRAVQKLKREFPFEVIISDNRYGVFHPSAQNIMMTHQISFFLPGVISSLINQVVRSWINKFDQCWIPDFCGADNLSGKLSQGHLKIEKYFIGPLSRLMKEEYEKCYDVGVILSGPEPHRTILHKQLVQTLSNSRHCLYWVLGQPGLGTFTSGKQKNFGHLSRQAINQILNQTKLVISRSGYSSIMDYYRLEKKAILIPTPNQPEQKYLAERHSSCNRIYVPNQDLTDLEEGIQFLLDQRESKEDQKSMQIPRV